VPEFADIAGIQRRQLEESDIPLIARGQVASEDALALAANRILICDTDVLQHRYLERAAFWLVPRDGSRSGQQPEVCAVPAVRR